jgi:hypothetical protein
MHRRPKPMNSLFKTFSVCALLVTTSLASAASITYSIQRFIPAQPQLGSTYLQAIVNGSITTNGKIGLLSSADVLSYSLTVNFPSQSMAFGSQIANSFLIADGVVADSTTLSVVASMATSTSGNFTLMSPNQNDFWGVSFADQARLPGANSGESAFRGPTQANQTYQYASYLIPYSTSYTFASTSTSAVPLPSSLALVAPLMLFALRRHRRM